MLTELSCEGPPEGAFATDGPCRPRPLTHIRGQHDLTANHLRGFQMSGAAGGGAAEGFPTTAPCRPLASHLQSRPTGFNAQPAARFPLKGG